MWGDRAGPTVREPRQEGQGSQATERQGGSIRTNDQPRRHEFHRSIHDILSSLRCAHCYDANHPNARGILHAGCPIEKGTLQ